MSSKLSILAALTMLSTEKCKNNKIEIIYGENWPQSSTPCFGTDSNDQVIPGADTVSSNSSRLPHIVDVECNNGDDYEEMRLKFTIHISNDSSTFPGSKSCNMLKRHSFAIVRDKSADPTEDQLTGAPSSATGTTFVISGEAAVAGGVGRYPTTSSGGCLSSGALQKASATTSAISESFEYIFKTTADYSTA